MASEDSLHIQEHKLKRKVGVAAAPGHPAGIMATVTDWFFLLFLTR